MIAVRLAIFSREGNVSPVRLFILIVLGVVTVRLALHAKWAWVIMIALDVQKDGIKSLQAPSFAPSARQTFLLINLLLIVAKHV